MKLIKTGSLHGAGFFVLEVIFRLFNNFITLSLCWNNKYLIYLRNKIKIKW